MLSVKISSTSWMPSMDCRNQETFTFSGGLTHDRLVFRNVVPHTLLFCRVGSATRMGYGTLSDGRSPERYA